MPLGIGVLRFVLASGIGMTWDGFVPHKQYIGMDATGETDNSLGAVVARWSKDQLRVFEFVQLFTESGDRL